MFRILSLAILLATGLGASALAQTSEKPVQTESHQSETKKADSATDSKASKSAKKAPDKVKDVDSFFKDAEKQYEKEGQSCRPPPDPIV